MVELRKNSTRVEVRQWWVAIKAQQTLFFHLIKQDALARITFRDIDAIIEHLELDYRSLQDMVFPQSATSIRQHLLHAIEHIMDSLWSLKNRQLFECDLRYNIAQIDMTMLKHELSEYGITD